MKKKGFSIIETVAALFVYLILGTIIAKVSFENVKTLQERKEYKKVVRAFNAVCIEVKENYTNLDIEKILNKKSFVINYKENLLETLLYEKLFDLEEGIREGDYIEVKLLESNDYYEKIQVIGNFGKGNKTLKTEVFKGIWEEVNEN